MGDERAAARWDAERNLVVYRASASGMCIRALVAARRGETPLPPSDQLEEYFAAGWAFEDVVVDRLTQQALVVSDTGSAQQEYAIEVVPGRIIILGHLDGMDLDNETGLPVPCEFKSMGTSTFEKWMKNPLRALAANPRYAAQASVIMAAYKSPLRYVLLERVTVEPPTFDANRQRIVDPGVYQPGRMHTFMVTTPPVDIEVVKTRIVMAEAWANRDDELFPDCDVSTSEAFSCFFRQFHDTKKVDPATVLTDTDQHRLLQRLYKVDRLAKFCKSELEGNDGLKERVRRLGIDLDTNKLRAGDVSITLSAGWDDRWDDDAVRALIEKSGEDVATYRIRKAKKKTVTILGPKPRTRSSGGNNGEGMSNREAGE